MFQTYRIHIVNVFLNETQVYTPILASLSIAIHYEPCRWEVDEQYCSYVENVWPYNMAPRLQDFMDAVVLDHLIGNADRHHYETFRNNNDSMIILLDNAKR